MNEREIFQAALDHTDAEERRTYVAETCGSDVALRERVERLLAAHEAASQFLDDPAISIESTAPTMMQDEAAEESSDSDEFPTTPDISFLSPSSKPGSIGTLGHYEILQILGQGAFGVVFNAFDEKLHRHVAIKAMNPQMAATSPPRKRFLREARSVAAVKHENIVQIHAVEEQPLPYLVMEFVDGQTLQHKLDGAGPLEVPEILHLGRQMAAGLAAAHEKGLIHRDIKPGNILIEAGAEQKVKITDFGLARAADDATMTRTGMIAGTPMYMAPEQAMGTALDHRADLFSLGSVLYQMACGRPPFRGANAMAVLKRVVDEEPRAIQEILTEVPDWLCQIIAKLHAKAPENRYQSAKELADLLARCQSEWQTTGKVTSVPIPDRSVEVVPASSQNSAPIAQSAVKAQNEPITLPQRADTLAESRKSTTARSSSARWIIVATLLLLAGLLTWRFGPKLSVAHLSRPQQQQVASLPSIDSRRQDLKQSVSSQTSKAPTQATNTDRELAEWVLSPPGNRYIRIKGVESEIRSLEAVPSGPIRLEAVMIGLDRQIGKADFAKILTATGLVQLILNKTQDITDDDLRALAASPSAETISELSLDLTNCTNEVFQHLSQLRKLETLAVNLESPKLTDAGFRKLTLPELSFIQFSSERMTPACLTEMSKQLPKLSRVQLYWVPPDADLSPLTQFPLTFLSISTNSAGIATIAKITSLKQLDLMDNKGKYDEQDLNALSTLTDLESLGAGYSPITFEGVRCFETFTKLRLLALCYTQLSDKGLENVVKAHQLEHLNINNTKISDRGLALLETISSLDELLIVNNPQLTETAVRKLQAALPNCHIVSDFPNLTAPAPPTPSENPTDFAAERKVAGRLLRLNKGQVYLRLQGQPVLQLLNHPLPAEPFCIAEVNFSGADVTDDELVALSGCREIEKLNLEGNQKVTATGLAKLSPQPKLKYLSIGSTQIGDDGLLWLANSPLLTELNTMGSAITASGWKAFPPLPCLRHLHQWDQGLDDAGLERIVSQCPELRGLYFGGHINNTANDLTTLSQCARLRVLSTDSRVLTKAGIDAVHKLPVLDELQVIYPEQTGTEHLPRLSSKLTKLALQGRILGKHPNPNSFWIPVTQLSQLLSLTIGGQISLDGPNLQRLAALTNLRELTVENATDSAKFHTFTPDDVAAFRKARPDVELNIGGNLFRGLEDWPGKFEGSSSIAEWSGLPAGGPAPMIGSFTPETAKESQNAWAQHLGKPVEVTNSAGMKFQLIPAGEAVANFGTHEHPRYALQRVQPYYLGNTEVTIGQFKKFVEAKGYVTDAERLKIGRNLQVQVDPTANWRTPGFVISDELPVSIVSHTDAQAFCDWLNTLETKAEDSGLNVIYRLPTQAEMVFATRTGNHGNYSFAGTEIGLHEYAWVKETIQDLPAPIQPVAAKKANPFGLHDVYGNVWEWSTDDTGSASGVVGASSFENGHATIDRFVPGTEWIQPNVGFRVVRQLQPSRPAPKFAEQAILIPYHTPLGPQANVTRPAPIQGIRSWTVELTSTAYFANSASWRNQGDLIATTWEDSCVRLWDRNGRLKSVLFGQATRSGQGQFVRFSPDGNRLATLDMSIDSTSPNTLRIWQISRAEQGGAEDVTGKLVSIIPLPYWGLAVDWSPDGRHIAYGGTQGMAAILEVATGQMRPLTTGSEVSSITWSPDGQSLCLPIKGFPTVFDAATGEMAGPPLVLPDFQKEATYSTRVAWSPDGRWIASSNGKHVWICDAQTRQFVRMIESEHSAILSIAWQKDSNLLDVCGSGERSSLTVVDTTQGTTVARSPGWGNISGFARTPDESEIVVHSGILRFLDGKTCQPRRSGPECASSLQIWEQNPAFLSADGRRVHVKHTERLIFDAESGKLIKHHNSPPGRLLAVAPDETWQAYQTSDTEVTIEPNAFDRDSVMIRIPGHSHMWRAGPIGQYIAQAFNQDLWIWDVATGQPLEKKPHLANIKGFEWSPDGQQIVTAAEDKIIRMWDVKTNKLVAEYQKFPQQLTAGQLLTDGPSMAWTKDGRHLWIPQGGQAGLLELSSGKVSLLEQFVYDNIVHTLTIAPDGDRLLVRGGYQLTILRDRNGVHELLGQNLGHRPQWHPDSRRFLSGADGNANSVRGYDVATRRRMGTLWPILEDNHWLCIGPTGHYRGSSGIEDHIIYVAQLDDGSEITLSAAEFAARFNWKNDPEKATLLQLTD